MNKAGYGLAAVGAIGLLAAFQWQQGQIETLQRRVDTLEGELAEFDIPTLGVHPDDRTTLPSRAPAAARVAGGQDGPVAAHLPTAARPTTEGAPGQAPQPRYSDDQAMRAVVAALESDRPEIQEKVREVVRAQQEALWDERRERRQVMWEQRENARLERLATEANLSQSQVDALFAILTASRDRVGEMFRDARQNQSFEGVHERAEEIRKQADAEAQELLDEQQYKAYQSMREEQRESRRREHRPPPPPPPGE